MTLEDFERQLAADKSERSHHKKRRRSRSPDREDRHRHHKHHHHRSRHEDSDKHNGHRRHKSGRSHEGKDDRAERSSRKRSPVKNVDSSMHSANDDEDEWVEKDVAEAIPSEDILDQQIPADDPEKLQRDAWMVPPSAMDVDIVQRKRAAPKPAYVTARDSEGTGARDQEMEDVDTKRTAENGTRASARKITYKFGDSGSSWRMRKLDNIYAQAKQSGKSVEQIAMEHYGDLRDFDDAREEQIELDRRKNYGKDYIGKEQPTGELYLERQQNEQPASDEESSEDEFERAQKGRIQEKPPPSTTLPLDQTALNKLKAKMMKAKLSGSSDAAELEAQYAAALAEAGSSRQPDVVVLNNMENRMLAGGRKGEVKSIDNKRGRERGLVEENEDMSVEDMVRQERRTKAQFGGVSSLAARIAKDGKFDNDLDYMDDNASKLAKTIAKSSQALRNSAISDFQKTKRILDNCPLCHQEDTATPPQAPVVSLATRTFLTLPTSPEITPYGFCATIVPIQHRLNLLECDDDEWDEIRNFMKSLTRCYHALGKGVVFYENAAHEGRKRHASLEAIPLPNHLAETASQYFKEAILASDEEWTQHRKIIDTLANAEKGQGKLAFRRSMVTELPYFHVWFKLDGGLGHIVEDERRWPKGDLFAREVVGGMLDVGTDVIKKQGRWRRGDGEIEERVKKFRKRWQKWDWTSVLMDAAQ